MAIEVEQVGRDERVGREPGARRSTWRAEAVVLLVAVGAALVAWATWTQVAGVDLVVRRGAGTAEVGAGAVVLTTLLTGAAGVGLLRLLRRRTARGLRTWTIVAAVVTVLSLTGPLGAATVAAGTALASLHLVVASVVVVGLRRVHRDCVSAA